MTKDELLELAWGLIANAGWDAGTGNVDLAKSPGWHEAAIRWRDNYHESIKGRPGVSEVDKLFFDDQRYVEWREAITAGWPMNGQWCPRHWAPGGTGDYNGIGASTDMMSMWAMTKPTTSPAELVIALHETQERHGAVCCELGDDVMFVLWQDWPIERRADGQVDPEI